MGQQIAKEPVAHGPILPINSRQDSMLKVRLYKWNTASLGNYTVPCEFEVADHIS